MNIHVLLFLLLHQCCTSFSVIRPEIAYMKQQLYHHECHQGFYMCTQDPQGKASNDYDNDETRHNGTETRNKNQLFMNDCVTSSSMMELVRTTNLRLNKTL